MSQAEDWGMALAGPATMADVALRVNPSLDAVLTGHSGSARPAYATAGTVWQSTNISGKVSLYFYDGTNDWLLWTLTESTGALELPAFKALGAINLDSKAISNPAGEFIRGKISGLTLSNNVSDATNDIDIASGVAASDGTTPTLMVLSSALTKRLDAAWVVGSGNGGLDTGSVANTTYHVWLIQRSDTGIVDVLFSASATSPTMPTNYDRKRRIGSIVRVSNTILLFGQEGDYFYYTGGTVAQTLTITTTASLVALDRAPLGINSIVVGTYYQIHSGGAAVIITPPDSADTTPNTTSPFSAAANASEFGLAKVFHRTDTSARLRFRGTASIATAKIMVEGWIDRRGQ